MGASLRFIFLSRHGDLRSGWRILAFGVLVAGTGFVLSLLAGAAIPRASAIPMLGAAVFLVATLLASWVMTRFVNRKPFPAIGLWFHPTALREFGIGLLLGFLMMSGIFIVLFAAGYLTVEWLALAQHEVIVTAVYSLVFFAFAAAVEELLFRGYPFQTLAQGITMLPAILLMSGLFGVAHVMNPHATPLSTGNVMLAGIWLSFAYIKTRGLWLPFGLHLAWNFTQTTVYGFPTSGMEFAGHRLWSTVATGPEWITGGAFGPEGSVLATLALIGGIWYVLKSPHLRAPEGIITLDTLEDVLPPSAQEPPAP